MNKTSFAKVHSGKGAEQANTAGPTKTSGPAVPVSTSLPDYYALLGVPPSATHDEIRSAYIHLAVLFHPDKGRFKNNLVRRAEELEKFKNITQAKMILLDTKRRAAYDAERGMLMDDCPRCRGKGIIGKQQGFSKRISMHCPDCNGRGKLARQR